MVRPSFIYKIATADVVARSRQEGRFIGMPIDIADGYLHFSTAEQLAETLRLHFAGQSGLVVFSVPTAAVADRLKLEPSRGGQLFPHLYGDLAMALIAREAVVSVPADGAIALPEWVQ